jgi:hypothetical protein
MDIFMCKLLMRRTHQRMEILPDIFLKLPQMGAKMTSPSNSDRIRENTQPSSTVEGPTICQEPCEHYFPISFQQSCRIDTHFYLTNEETDQRI